MDDKIKTLRDALVAIQKLVQANIAADEFEDLEPLKEYVQIRDICNAVLAAPSRNCDMGTPEEQTKRFSGFCAAHRHTDLPRCAGCPLENTPSSTGCSFAWAQMPYEEGEAGK